TTSMPASASTDMSAEDTYFVAATMVTAEPTSSRMRERRARTSSGDSTDHPLGAVPRPAVTAREDLVGMAPRAEVEPLDGADAGAQQGPLRGCPEVELAFPGEVVSEALGDLGADLVAAGTDRGTDDRSGLAAAERGGARLDHPGCQAAPARVDDGERRSAV